MIIMMITMIEARSIRRPTFQMYSASTGRHLTIDSKKVGSTRQTNSPSATVKLVNVGDNAFLFQGVLTGLYLAKPHNNRSRRVKTTDNIEKAARFTEQLSENYFNQYKLTKTDCALSIRKTGSVRISCVKKNSKSTSFLPRRVHEQRNLYKGKHL